jgi:hypothetical protein
MFCHSPKFDSSAARKIGVTVLFRPYICHASRKGFELKLFTVTVTSPQSGQAKNKAKDVTFCLSRRASRAIHATNEAVGTFGHALTAHKALLKIVTGEAKGHAQKGPKLRSKKYSMSHKIALI